MTQNWESQLKWDRFENMYYFRRISGIMQCISFTLTSKSSKLCVFIMSYTRIFSWMSLLAQNRCDIWSLRGCNNIWTHYQLVRKRTLNKSFSQTGQNRWVFLYTLNGCGFESSCSHLNIQVLEEGSSNWRMGNN